VGCRSESTTPQKTQLPFSTVFITTDADFAPGTNLCVVLDTPAARGAECDQAVAEHAAAALQAAKKATGHFQYVVFFLRRTPESKSGSVAAFTLTQLQDIAKLSEAGKEFNSRQSWVLRTLPAKQNGSSEQTFKLIWRESSEIPIERVETPKGFKISPAEAVKPIMARSSRAPWAEFYLFVDASSYYFGNTKRGTQLSSPEPGHWIINGTTGNTAYVEKDDTEPAPGHVR
jgi:hypothetical protein